MIDKFEKSYFDDIYGKEYLKRNTPNKLQSFLKEILRFKRKGNLLDFGCAYGLFIKVASKYFNCQGLDISSYAVKLARKNLPKNIKIYNDEIVKVDFQNMFDVVTCFDVLEHLNNLEESLNKVKRILKKSGIIALTVPVYDGPVGDLVALADQDPTHVHKMCRKWWIKILERKGFKILEYKGVFRYFLFRRFYLNWVSFLISGFSPAIYIIAQK